MKWYRIRALLIRTFKLTFRGIDPLVDFFYWPLFDIVVWGFTSRWVQTYQTTNSNVSLTLLTALVIWQACYRANLDISFNLLSELWSRNIVNLFATPLELKEWMACFMVVGLINTCIAVFFGMIAVWLLYSINVLSVGWVLIPFFISLVISGWSIGFLTASTIIYWGQHAQKFVWVMGWFFVPFSAVFYPMAVLPQWAQAIAKALPMTYVFEALRKYITTHSLSYQYLVTSFVLNGLYLAMALLLFKFTFDKSKSKGLARLEVD
jgi:ABC-2 type transport system permease protein